MYQTSKKQAIKTLLATALLALATDALSAQVLIGKQGDRLSASVSRSEPTLIQIEGHHVRKIFGAEGDFIVSPDKVAGAAYLKPATDKPAFSVFVSDENGRTWNLLLSVVDGPAEIITIKEPGGSGTAFAKKGHDLPREEAIKQMIFALMNQSSQEDDAQVVNDIIPLWKEAKFVRVEIIKGNSLVGEKYDLTNISNKPMDINERELYRSGVVAIRVKTPYLQPSETTEVYVISNNSEAE